MSASPQHSVYRQLHRLKRLWWCLVFVHDCIALLSQRIISVKKSKLKHWSPQIQWPVTGNLWMFQIKPTPAAWSRSIVLLEVCCTLCFDILRSQLPLTVTSEGTPVAWQPSAQTILSALLISASSRHHLWLDFLKMDLFTSTLDVTWILDIIAALP